jgi:hypothetical protein
LPSFGLTRSVTIASACAAPCHAMPPTPPSHFPFLPQRRRCRARPVVPTFRNASLRLDTHSDSFCTGTCRSSRKPRQSEAKMVRAMLQPVARCCDTHSLQKLRRRDLPCRAERVRAIAARHRLQADGASTQPIPCYSLVRHQRAAVDGR